MTLYRMADERKLVGLNRDLVAVVRRVAMLGPHFIISEGLRTKERQRELFNAGKSKTLNSKHLVGRAVDCYPVGKPISDMERRDFRHLVDQAKYAASQLGVPMEFGYDWGWDAPHWELKETND